MTVPPSARLPGSRAEGVVKGEGPRGWTVLAEVGEFRECLADRRSQSRRGPPEHLLAGRAVEPVTAVPQHRQMFAGVGEPPQRLDRLPHRQVQHGPPGVVNEMVDVRGHVVSGGPPDEARACPGERVDVRQPFDEAGESRMVQPVSGERQVRLREFVTLVRHWSTSQPPWFPMLPHHRIRAEPVRQGRNSTAADRLPVNGVVRWGLDRAAPRFEPS